MENGQTFYVPCDFSHGSPEGNAGDWPKQKKDGNGKSGDAHGMKAEGIPT